MNPPAPIPASGPSVTPGSTSWAKPGLLKLGIVLAGYGTAFLLTCAFFYVREFVMPQDAQASAGMQAFADLFLFLAMFGTLSLIPTGLALFFLRKSARFWSVFSILCLAFAATGPVSAICIQRSWGALEFFKIPRVLGAPLFCLAFLIAAALVPTRRVRPPLIILNPVDHSPAPGELLKDLGIALVAFPRWPFLTAAGLEAVVALYSYFCLFILRHWLL
jgi:hypothetical protein